MDICNLAKHIGINIYGFAFTMLRRFTTTNSGIMKLVGGFFKSATGGEKNPISLAIGMIKDAKDNVSSKRIISAVGGSALIATGVTFLTGIDFSENVTVVKIKAAIGLTLCAMGAALAVLMKSKDPA